MAYEPDDLLRSFERRVQEQMEQAQRLSARMDEATATVESPGGEVRVTVDATGGLADLQFGAAAERVSLDRLATLVLDTSRQAQARITRTMGELVADVYGAGSATAQFVAGAYAERFATPAQPGEEDRFR